MLKINTVLPRVLHTVNYEELDAIGIDSDDLYEEAWGSYDQVDYCDGDFKWPVDLSDKNTKSWVKILKEHLPQEVINTNKFAIYFYQ